MNAAEPNAAFDQYVAAVRARRNSLVLVSVGIVATLFVFVWSCYASVRENFSRERVAKEAERVGVNLFEAAQPRLVDAAKELVPVYRTEAERALQELMPKLRERATAELKLAQEHFAEKSRDALQEIAAAPLEGALHDLMQQFPALQDEQFVAELLKDTENTLRSELEGALRDGQSIYQPQLRRLTAAMAALRSDELSAQSDDELVQRFMHLWLLLIDTELMGRAPCSLDTLSMAAKPKTERDG